MLRGNGEREGREKGSKGAHGQATKQGGVRGGVNERASNNTLSHLSASGPAGRLHLLPAISSLFPSHGHNRAEAEGVRQSSQTMPCRQSPTVCRRKRQAAVLLLVLSSISADQPCPRLATALQPTSLYRSLDPLACLPRRSTQSQAGGATTLAPAGGCGVQLQRKEAERKRSEKEAAAAAADHRPARPAMECAHRQRGGPGNVHTRRLPRMAGQQ